MVCEFEYKITSKNGVSIVTFKGKLTKETKDHLESCRQEISTDTSTLVIFYFKEVPAVDPAVFREFTLLQQEIRKKNVPLYLTGLDNSTKQYLVDRAVVRLSELKKSLHDVFEELAKAA